MKLSVVAAMLMMGTMGLAFAQGTGEGTGGGLGSGSTQTGGTAAPGMGKNPGPSGTIPGVNNDVPGLPPCGSTTTPQSGCNAGGTAAGIPFEIPGQ